MAKFYGYIGYVKTVDDGTGVWRPVTEKRRHAGDMLTSSRRYDNGTSVNDDLVLSSRLSIVADDFVRENLSMIKWVEYMGVKWKVTNIEVSYPRLILSFGGVYNADDEE